MSRDGCREMAGDLAMRALGREADVSGGLDAHLEGCAECRAELDELRSVAAAITGLEADTLAEPLEPPASLGQRIAVRVGDERRARRRRRVGMLTAAAAVVVASLGVVAAVRWSSDSDEQSRRVEIGGMGDVAGSARLRERPWGTEVTLDVTGLDDG